MKKSNWYRSTTSQCRLT